MTRWKDQGVTVTVELGLGADRTPDVLALWGTAKWGAANATWTSSEPQWRDLSCESLSCSIERGAEHVFTRFGASSCSVTALNVDGWVFAADPLLLRPGRPMRILAHHPTLGSVSLWRGYVDAVRPVHDAGHSPGVLIDGTDGLAELAQINLLERVPEGAGELSGARIKRILDVAVWPADLRDIDVGSVAVQATNLARNLLDEVGVTADSEGGAVYCDKAGRIVFRQRDWLRTRGVNRGTLPGTAGCPTGYRLEWSNSDLANRIILARAGGTERRYDDPTSQALYGVKSWGRNDLICTSDVDVDRLGQQLLQAKARGDYRVAAVQLDTATEDVWPLVLQGDYADRVTVTWSDDTGHTWTRPCLIVGQHHQIDADAWTCDVALDDATAYQPTAPWGRAGWGVNRWTTATREALV